MPLITTCLDVAVSDLRAGKPVAIPTETVYGLAAMISKPEAIAAVFDMKKRPRNHPLIVHVSIDYDLSQLVKTIPEYAQELIKRFWPGPLTLVLQAKMDILNPLVTGGQSTVAIRCPAHPLAQRLLQTLDSPVVAPSANPFGKISPTTAQHVEQAFDEYDLVILDGGRCIVGIESTILDATHPNTYTVLRHGLIDEHQIAEVISIQCLNEESTIRVPGKLEHHYQPQKPFYYFNDVKKLLQFCQKEKQVYVIAREKPAPIPSNYFYPLSQNPKELAYDLYYQLRKADASDATCIAMELPPTSTEWQGINERIYKAGQAYL